MRQGEQDEYPAPVHDNHDELYRHARIYDVAFGYRDFAAELAFLVACHEKWGRGRTDSFLEVAAGPGVHAVVAAQRGMRAIALDLSPSMMALCAEKAAGLGVPVETVVADMRSFGIREPVAVVFNPITSISYLRSLDALVEHMGCVARALRPGGIYVVENNHPKDFFTREHFVPSVWTMTEGDLTVQTTWLAQCPPRMDSSQQLYEAVARYEVNGTLIEDRAWLRMTLPSELKLAAAAAGLVERTVLGDLSFTEFNDDAWRAVSVFVRA